MQLGIVFPHHEIGTDPGAIKAYAQGAEELGADHMLIYDHVLGADPNRPGGWSGPFDKDVAFHEPFTVFAFMAALTSRIEFVTGVLVLPQRQTALVAKQAAELAILSGNRLRLGVGTGWNAVEYEALAVPFAERGKRQQEQVEVLRRLWASDNLTYAGSFHTVTQASILPRPDKPIPIWFGGSAPALLKRCAVLGDGWLPPGEPDAATAQAIAAIRAHRTAAALEWRDFGIQARAQYRGGNPEHWRDHASRWQALGCTHLAIVTQNAGNASVEDHLAAVREYFNAVGELAAA